MRIWSKTESAAFREKHMPNMPALQPHHNFPHADIKTYFDLLFGSDCPEYKGLVPIVIRCGDGTFKLIKAVPADQLGSWAEKMHISTRCDYYFGRAQQYKPGPWGTENALSYNFIAVDIDAHDGHSPADGRQIMYKLCYWLEDSGYPIPNIAEYTGRGIHLVWCIQQVSAKLDWMVREVSRHYAQMIQSLLQNIGILGYQVDMGYSSNVAGLTRIPGTYNTAAGTYGSYVMLHRQRMDLPRAYDSIPLPPRYKGSSSNRWTTIGLRRLDALMRLHELRPIDVGQRDLYLWHTFCAAQMAGLSNNEAMAYVQTVNRSLAHPLGEREVERSLSTSNRKRYHPSNQRLIDNLAITPEMQAAIGLSVAAPRDTNRARKARNAEKKRQRNRAIMEGHLRGMSTAAIARAVGHAYNTICKVITEYAHKLSELFTAHELWDIYLSRLVRSSTSHIRGKNTISKDEARNIILLEQEVPVQTALSYRQTPPSPPGSDFLSRRSKARNGPCRPVPGLSAVKSHAAELLENLDTLDFLFEVLCKRNLWIYSPAFLGCLYHYQDYKQKRN